MTGQSVRATTEGDVLAESGASVEMNSSAADPLDAGGVISQLPANRLRLHRVTLSVDLQTTAVQTDVRLVLDAARASGQRVSGYAFDDRLSGSVGWTPRTLSIVVPADASSVSLGLQLRGAGMVAARHLRLSTGPAVTVDSPMLPEAAQVLEAALDAIKHHTLTASKVDWISVEREARVLAAGAIRTSDAYPAIVYVIGALGDGHSSFWSPDQWRVFNASQANGFNPAPTVTALPAGVGYLDMPFYAGGIDDLARTYVVRVQSQVSQLMANASCGWVIDLRRNTGGNVWPELASLKPFLDDQPLGGNAYADGRPHEQRGANIGVPIPPAMAGLASVPVAVLVGPDTKSAGEAVVLAFRGREKTRIFGQPTGGRTTAVGQFPLPDGAMLGLAETIMTDRTGKMYGGSIEPDETIAQARPPDIYDETTAAATQWLRQLSDCR